MPPTPFSPLHAGPLRRGILLLVAAAAAHIALAALALSAWQAAPAPMQDPTAALAPLAAVTTSPVALPALALLGLGLAALCLYAATALNRLTPHARRVTRAAAFASLVNVPVGSFIGLLVLGQMSAPRVVRLLQERSATRRILVRKV